MTKTFLNSLLILTVILCGLSFQAMSQLTVDTGMAPTQMVQNLVGTGVQILNVQVTAAPNSYGYYYSNGTEMGTNEGLLLTTGHASNAIGPNNSSGLCISNCDQYDNNFPGSPLLNLAQNRTTFDATMIEFDIIPAGDSLHFDYTFASEEYLEWVGSPFNDVFGFYISGPNVGTDVNIALIPNTSSAVAINNVNNVSNSQYFYNNQSPLGQGIQYDGFTLGLQAIVGDLIPCQTYHLKLVIADGSDRIYDSGVFINKIQSNPLVVLTATAGGLDYMIEGCNDGVVTFARTVATSSPQVVTYWVDGSATNGVDYTLLGSGIPLDPINIVIPANELSVSIPIQAFADGLTEGTEYITFYLGNPLCAGVQALDSTDFYIHDFLEASITASPLEICSGTCTILTGIAETTGSATFEWSPTTGLSNPTSLITDACPTETTTYTLSSTVADCFSQASVTINVSTIEVSLSGTDVNCQNGNTGIITTTVTNAIDPLSFSWTGPNGYTSSDENPIGLAPGQYCVTVTDAAGCSASACITLIQTNELAISNGILSNFFCYPISCNGASDGSIDIEVTGGVEAYSYDWTGPNGFSSGNQDISGLEAGVYSVTITDAVGCILMDSYTLEQPDPIEIQVVGSIDVLCNGTETGQAEVSATGGCTPYFYSWSHDPNLTAPLATNLGSGIYTVSVSDVNGCASSGSVQITINDPINPLTVTVDEISLYPGGYNVSCPGIDDAYINITIANGTMPYTIDWTLAGQAGAFSNLEDLSNAPCGQYTLTVTDDNGCEFTQDFDLTCVPDITITTDVVPNPCGDENAGVGSITLLTTNGGHGGAYTYFWTGPNSFTSNSMDITGLVSGDYLLTVTDQLGCSAFFTVIVGTNSDFDVTAIVTDLGCAGVCDGSIDVTVVPSGSYTFVWNGPSGSIPGTEDQFNLCAGDYTLAVTANGCTGIFNYTLIQPTPIIIDIVSTTDPICFGQNNGSIDVTVSGGVGALTIEWLPNPSLFFFGASTEDINNLFDGCYTIVVTDESGCSVTQDICLSAPQVMQIFVEVSEFNGGFNISCADAQDGAISVSVSGGTPNCVAFTPFCYLYDWSNCDDVNPTEVNSPNLTGLAAGTYCVNVTDDNGCLATTTIDLQEPLPITDNSSVTDVTCNGANDGTITPGLNGGSGTYIDFDWTQGNIGSNPSNASTLTNLTPGCYTLVVTDNNQCTNEFTWCITEPELLQLSIDLVQQVSCPNSNDGSIAASAAGGTGSYTFVITGPGGPYNSNVVSDLAPGTYTVTVTDENGCSVSLDVIIDQPEPFDVVLTVNIQDPGQIYSLQCFGDNNASITSLVSGGLPGYTYEWTDGDGNVIGNSDSINGLSAGTYCLEVIDSNGCNAVACYEITQPDSPLIIDAAVSTYPGGYNISCYNACDGSIDLIITGGVEPYIFQWELGTGNLDNNEDQASLCAGPVEVLVTDANGCSQLIQFDLTEPAPLQINPTLSQFDGGYNISCNGSCDGSISISPAGGDAPYTVNWLDPILPSGETQSDLCPGDYLIELVDAIGCSVQQTVTLIEPEVLAVTITNNYSCANGTMQLCALITGGSGNYSTNWSTGETTLCIDVDADGNYCVTATDSNGCSATVCFDAVVPEILSATVVVTDATCGQSNGAIDLTVIGGSPNFIYVWTGPGIIQGSEDQVNLGAGNYSISITDANDCSVTVAPIQLSSINAVTLVSTITNVTCNGNANGSIGIAFQGGTNPITFTWTGPNGALPSDNPLTGLAGGVYTIDWQDGSGCSGSEDFTVVEPAALTIGITLSQYDLGFNVSEFGGSDGAIDTDVQGGTPFYTYTWSPITGHNGEPDLANLPAGDYILTVTDANGCSLDTTITITEPLDLALPTGLSPNGDGFNDGYVILGIEGFLNNEFRVFNRWGNLVYEKKGYNNEWVGQNKSGDTLPDGTYFVVFIAGGREFNTYVDLRR